MTLTESREVLREAMVARLPENRLAKRVLELRKKLGYSQQDLADLSGTTQSQIAKIEAGSRHLPKRENLYAIAQALRTSTLDLLIHAGYIADQEITSGVDPRLIAEARGATPELQDAAITVLRAGRH